jgi:hypothetical protein
MTFANWWNTEGARYLGPNNKIPTIEERCRAAYEAGMADQRQHFDLPPAMPTPEVEILNEEERE